MSALESLKHVFLFVTDECDFSRLRVMRVFRAFVCDAFDVVTNECDFCRLRVMKVFRAFVCGVFGVVSDECGFSRLRVMNLLGASETVLSFCI